MGTTTLITGSGSNPTITNTAAGGDGITLANGVAVQRVSVSGTNDEGIVGTAITTATIGSNIAITSTGGNGFELSGAAGGTIDVGASISNVTGRHVSVANRSSGTVTFSAALSGTGTGVVLASNTGATIAFSGQLTLSTGTTNAFDASGGGTITVSHGSNALTTTTGTALLLNGVGGAIQFNSVSAGTTTDAPTIGISLTNATADVTITTGSIQNTTIAAVSLNGSNGDFGYAGSISVGAGRAVLVQNRTAGGTDSFGGAITATDGTGIHLSGNANTIIFTGALTLSTGANAAFTATNASLQGTISVDPVSTNNNVLTTTTGTALAIDDTNISANGVEFRSISAGQASGAQATNGIVLNNTGTSGGLTALGTGSAGTGGIIQRTTGDAISLTNTRQVSLAWMTIQNNDANGIRGTTVTTFTLANSSLLNNATDDGTSDEANIRFAGLFGTAQINDNNIGGADEDQIRIFNTTGPLNLTIRGGSIHDTAAGPPGNQGINLDASGSANVTAIVGYSGPAGTTTVFDNNRAGDVKATTNGTATMDITVNRIVSTDTGNGGVSVDLGHNSSGTFSFDVTNNTITGNTTPNSASPININKAVNATGTMSGTVADNDIDNNNSAVGPGMRLISNGNGGTLTVAVTGNQVREVQNVGIQVIARAGSTTVNATIENNDVQLTGALASNAIEVSAGVSSATDTTSVCADIAGNTATTTPGLGFGISVAQLLNNQFRLVGLPAGSNDNGAAIATFLSGQNNGATADVFENNNFRTIASCPTP